MEPVDPPGWGYRPGSSRTLKQGPWGSRTAGLRGTGSNDIVVKDAFVPAYRSQSHLDYTHGLGTPLPGQARNDSALYRLPWAAVFGAVIAAGAVGAAKGFVDTWTEETKTRRTNYGGVLRDEPVVQAGLAKRRHGR